MSDTPKLPDECKRLLDNGWSIVVFQNAMRTYTAMALNPRHAGDLNAIQAITRAMYPCNESKITDDFEPSQALTRLASKVFGCEVPNV